MSGNFRLLPAKHNGSDPFSFRIYFSEGVGISADAMSDHALSVSEGTVSRVKAVASNGRIWELWVSPHGRDDVTIAIEPDLDCALPGAICASDGRSLYNRMELTVEVLRSIPPTGRPTITGALDVGKTLTVDTSDISDADGLTTASFSYQWVSYDGNDCTDILGENDAASTSR